MSYIKVLETFSSNFDEGVSHPSTSSLYLCEGDKLADQSATRKSIIIYRKLLDSILLGRGDAQEENIMQKRSISKDRSGVSTMIIAAIVVVVVIIAAVAVYVVLSNDKEEETFGPGTSVTYNITSSVYGEYVVDQKVVGQNAEEYFFEVQVTAEGLASLYYTTDSKSLPEGAKKTGTEEIETMDGLKKLDVWEYSETQNGEKMDIKTYDDPATGISYRHEVTATGYSETQNLTAYEIVMQKSYEESEGIGKTYKYSAIGGDEEFKGEIVCVADCLEDQYGIFFDIDTYEGGIYVISDHPEGLPTLATDTKVTIVLEDTIDGDVTTEMWQVTLLDGTVWTFYVEPESHVIYAFSLTVAEETLTYTLDEKPQ